MGRNADGTFPKNTSGNPGGRPKVAELRKRLAKLDPEAEQQLEIAIRAGEPWAIRMHFEYRWGRPEIIASCLDEEKLAVDIEIAKAKLEMLKRGENPDAQQITVVIPESLKRDGE